MSETKIIYSDMIEKTIATLSKQGTKIISLTTNIYNFLYKFISIFFYIHSHHVEGGQIVSDVARFFINVFMSFLYYFLIFIAISTYTAIF